MAASFFSKKAFFNIVNLCRDTCSYCTYKAEIGESKLSMMNLEDVEKLAKLADVSCDIEKRTGEISKQAVEFSKQNKVKQINRMKVKYNSQC